MESRFYKSLQKLYAIGKGIVFKHRELKVKEVTILSNFAYELAELD